ncbi:hypothetical protein C5S29_13675 [ANME-1 cluster archaeon GoMg3.2]|nr:hypothetical protein [ANME-1 cluster archaeon GoMg3.2]
MKAVFLYFLKNPVQKRVEQKNKNGRLVVIFHYNFPIFEGGRVYI